MRKTTTEAGAGGRVASPQRTKRYSPKPTAYVVAFTYGMRQTTVYEDGWVTTSGTGGPVWFALSLRQAMAIIKARLKNRMHTDSGRPDHQFCITPIYGPFAASFQWKGGL